MKDKDTKIAFENQSFLVQAWFRDCGICPELMDINMGTDLQVRWLSEGFSKELKERFINYEKYIQEKYKG